MASRCCARIPYSIACPHCQEKLKFLSIKVSDGQRRVRLLVEGMAG